MIWYNQRMDICVFCRSTARDSFSILCHGCIDYIENMAHFEGEDLDDELKNMETMLMIFFILLVRAGHTRLNLKTARLSLKKYVYNFNYIFGYC